MPLLRFVKQYLSEKLGGRASGESHVSQPDYPICKVLSRWGPFQQNWEVIVVAIT